MKCRTCKQPFDKRLPGQVVCGYECALSLAQSKRAKKEASDHRKAKAAAKSRSKWMQEAQQAFNAWIRARDEALPCVSCSRVHTGQHHASHYRSVGSSPALRFDPANVHKSCAPCNSHLHGNLVPYRVELLRRVGADEVARLEGPQPVMKYTIDDLKAIKAEYQRKLKELG